MYWGGEVGRGKHTLWLHETLTSLLSGGLYTEVEHTCIECRGRGYAWEGGWSIHREGGVGRLPMGFYSIVHRDINWGHNSSTYFVLVIHTKHLFGMVSDRAPI